MEKENNLEEIFWKDGKFIRENGEEVNPKPIGIPVTIGNFLGPEVNFGRNTTKEFGVEANAFCRGSETNGFGELNYLPYQLYKI